MSDSDSSSEKNKNKIVKKSPPKNNFANNNTFEENSPIKKNAIQDQTPLYEQNRKLRRKLKELSARLDQQLERAAQNKLKMQHLAKMNHPSKPQSQSLQLQNAYKMIERLQKSVKDFQNKESYQVSLKRILDLQSIIKKKEQQIQDLKVQIKTQKKIIRDKQKHIAQLIQNSKKQSNPTEDKEFINRLKNKMKKLADDNEQLRKKQLNKHEKLVKAQRKLVQIQQEDEMPIGREESLLQQLQDFRKKYKEAMQRVEKQNMYITKLNEKLSISKDYAYSAKNRKSQGNRSSISKSVQELPSLNPKKIRPSLQFMQHLPSPKAPLKLKRY